MPLRLLLIVVSFTVSAGGVTLDQVRDCGDVFVKNYHGALASKLGYVMDPVGSYHQPANVARLMLNPLAWAYTRMAIAGAYLYQNDPQYLDLVRDQNAGLCVSASMTNTIVAIKGLHHHNFLGFKQIGDFAAAEMKKIKIRAAQKQIQIERGMALTDAQPLLRSLLADQGLEKWVAVQHIEANDFIKRGVFTQNVPINRGSIWIGTFFDSVPENHGHAVVILDVDPSEQKILISDPNAPNYIWERPYRLGRAQGALTMIIDSGLPNTGWTAALSLRELIELRPHD
jgi:hypothetical protein